MASVTNSIRMNLRKAIHGSPPPTYEVGLACNASLTSFQTIMILNDTRKMNLDVICSQWRSTSAKRRRPWPQASIIPRWLSRRCARTVKTRILIKTTGKKTRRMLLPKRTTQVLKMRQVRECKKSTASSCVPTMAVTATASKKTGKLCHSDQDNLIHNCWFLNPVYLVHFVQIEYTKSFLAL